MKNKMAKSVIGLLMMVGLVLIAGLVITGCLDVEACPGTAECTITIIQTASGLIIDTSAPLSSCGKGRSYNTQTGSWASGCRVENMRNGYERRYGTWTCNC